jgi:hypothetical protein
MMFAMKREPNHDPVKVLRKAFQILEMLHRTAREGQGGDGQAATVDHYDFGIAGFNADEARAKLKARNLKLADGNSKESFKFRDPDGFQIQLNAPDYVGHVS